MTNQEFIEIISLEGEIWKDVIGYEGLYMVSSFARIVILSKEIVYIDGRIRYYPPRLLLCDKRNKQGYKISILTKNKKTKYILTHRIVAKAFLPNKSNFPIVEHLDCNKDNCCVQNLRWCNQSTNMNNPITILNCRKAIKPRNNPNISTPIAQIKDGKIIKIFPSMHEAQREGFSQARIWLVCNKKAHTHAGFIWRKLSECESLINKSKNESSDAES